MGEKDQTSWWGPHQPSHGCFLACGGEEGSELAGDGGCDGGEGESCSQQGVGLCDCCDHNGDVGLPISGPAESPEVAPHLGG